jgi:putative membrane protein
VERKGVEVKVEIAIFPAKKGMELNLITIFKSIHIIGFVAWFAGLFYLVRILIYHTEALDKADPEKSVLTKQFQQMEWRVYKIICNPAMMITWTFGIGMLIVNTVYLQFGWMHAKLLFVVLLTIYHLMSKRMIKQLEKGEAPMDAFRLRLFNEVPTLFLAGIVFLAVLGKANNLNYMYWAVGLLVFGGLMYFGARSYARKRAAKEG